MVFSWDNDVESEPAAPLIHRKGSKVATLAGYINHPDMANPWDITSLVAGTELNNDTVSGLGGVFAILQANQEDEDVRVWTSASRTAAVYWIEGPSFYAVKSRGRFCSHSCSPGSHGPSTSRLPWFRSCSAVGS